MSPPPAAAAQTGAPAKPPRKDEPPPAALPAQLSRSTATPKEEAARAHYERGVEFYEQSNFAAAWLEFSSAYQLVPLVALLNNMARCEVKIGRPDEALSHYRSYLAAEPNDQDAEYIRQEISRLETEASKRNANQAAQIVNDTPPPVSQRRWPIYSIAAGATTLALLVGGAATLGVVSSRYGDLYNICGMQMVCRDNDVINVQRQADAGFALLGVGVATGIATGLLLRWELKKNKENSLRPIAGLSVGTPLGLLGRY